METSLKKEAEEFFQSVGLDVTTVIRLFLNRVLIRKKISFEKESKESISRAQALEIFYALRASAKNVGNIPGLNLCRNSGRQEKNKAIAYK